MGLNMKKILKIILKLFYESESQRKAWHEYQEMKAKSKKG